MAWVPHAPQKRLHPLAIKAKWLREQEAKDRERERRERARAFMLELFAQERGPSDAERAAAGEDKKGD